MSRSVKLLWWGTKGDQAPTDPQPKYRPLMRLACALLRKHDTYLYQWQRDSGHVTMCCMRCGQRKDIEFDQLADWLQATIIRGWTKHNFLLWQDHQITLFALAYQL